MSFEKEEAGKQWKERRALDWVRRSNQVIYSFVNILVNILVISWLSFSDFPFFTSSQWFESNTAENSTVGNTRKSHRMRRKKKMIFFAFAIFDLVFSFAISLDATLPRCTFQSVCFPPHMSKKGQENAAILPFSLPGNALIYFFGKNYMPIKIKIAAGDFLQIVVMQACSAFPLSPRIVFGETDWYI